MLKHKHLDNEGKLELLHMMSNIMSRNQIGLHNAQGKIKCQMKNWSCRIHDVGYDVQDILPENTGHINLLYL